MHTLHPTTLLSGWLLAVLASQSLAGISLLVALLVVPLLVAHARRRWWRLLCGARWLLLSLLVVLAWGTSGEPAWLGWSCAPTREGIDLALTHAGRLSLVLLAVAALRESVPATHLLAGVRRLLWPLRRCGVDADRGVVRLLLVLRYLEEVRPARDWRLLLAAQQSEAIDVLELADRSPLWYDYALQLAAAAGIAALTFFRALP